MTIRMLLFVAVCFVLATACQGTATEEPVVDEHSPALAPVRPPQVPLIPQMQETVTDAEIEQIRAEVEKEAAAEVNESNVAEVTAALEKEIDGDIN